MMLYHFFSKSYKMIFIIALILGTLLVHTANAARDKAIIQKEFDTVFMSMLDDPANVDLTLHYANLAIELKDYEAAIPALERVLLFNPTLSKVKQELGVMYYRLDSFDVARTYFEDALDDEGASEETTTLAQKYLAKLEE